MIENSIDLNDYIRPLRKWWWLLVLSALIAGASAGWYTSRQPLTYSSSTTIMVGTALLDPNPSGNEFLLAAQLADSYADMAGRSTIQEATARALGLTWLPKNTAYHPPSSQLVEISVNDIDPVRAQAVAMELVNQLIQRTPAGDTQLDRQLFINEQLERLEASIVDTQNEIERVQQELTEMFSARQIADARNLSTALETKLTTLQANYSALLANSQRGATNTITVLEPAELPILPTESNLPLNVAVAAAAGFALAAAGAYVLEYADNTIRSEEDAQTYLALPTLGLIPKGRSRGSDTSRVITTSARRSPDMDAYSGLRLNVQAALDHSPGTVLLTSSPSPGDGKSVVAADLSVALARSGQNVILVDTDLHRPSQQRLFNLKNQTGVTTFLTGKETRVDSLLQSTTVPGLSVLTSGPLPSNPGQLLASRHMQDLLESLRHLADTVVLDTPPISATVDASILATQADSVLLVIAYGRTKRNLAARSVKTLRQINAQILGIVLNEVPAQHSAYSYSYGYVLSAAPEKSQGNPDLLLSPANGSDKPTAMLLAGDSPGNAGKTNLTRTS